MLLKDKIAIAREEAAVDNDPIVLAYLDSIENIRIETIDSTRIVVTQLSKAVKRQSKTRPGGVSANLQSALDHAKVLNSSQHWSGHNDP